MRVDRRDGRHRSQRSRRVAAVATVLAAAAIPAALALSLIVAMPADAQSDDFADLRQRMVETQIASRDVHQPEVLEAMQAVPRHRFVPDENARQAYDDRPLPIGSGQTISQPYIVAKMTELLDLEPDDTVLEVGTGSGYHAAVMSRVAGTVYTIEIVEELGERARRTLSELGYDNVRVRIGDGYQGWPEKAPFDAIILTAAPPRIPEPLIEQLAVGGKMVVPVGSYLQDLQVLTKTEDGVAKRTVAPVRFVPMTGEIQNGGRD